MKSPRPFQQAMSITTLSLSFQHAITDPFRGGSPSPPTCSSGTPTSSYPASSSSSSPVEQSPPLMRSMSASDPSWSSDCHAPAEGHASNGAEGAGLDADIIKNDRLLTDTSMFFSPADRGVALPSLVGAGALGGVAISPGDLLRGQIGSDGDSIPDSPLSLSQDGKTRDGVTNTNGNLRYIHFQTWKQNTQA